MAPCGNAAVAVLFLAYAFALPLPGERDLSTYSYDDYEKEFGRNAVGQQRSDREKVFNRNLQSIREHNADPSKTWYMTVNEYADWTPDEFRAARTNHRPHPPQHFPQAAQLEASAPVDLPDSLDWRTKAGVVTDPKNQGACGGCWAFSAVETLESHLAIATGKPAPKLSTQQILSCTPNPKHCGGTGGCQGATQPLAFNYTETVGITTEADWPFMSESGKCDTARIKPVAKISGFTMLPANNYSALMNAVVTKGPIAISVAAGGLGWQLYGGGIMKQGPFNKGFDIDHAVQLVGYGEEKGTMYWLVRNSWGGWGEHGYIRIQRFGEGKEPCGMDNTPQDGMACAGDTKPVQYCGLCGILSSSSYPTGVQPAEEGASLVV
jgi:cathepsin L